MSRIQDRILQSHNMERKPGGRGLQSRSLPQDNTGQKSTLMRYIEYRFGEDIMALLALSQGSNNSVAAKLGVAHTTIGTWRKKLGIDTWPADDTGPDIIGETPFAPGVLDT